MSKVCVKRPTKDFLWPVVYTTSMCSGQIALQDHPPSQKKKSEFAIRIFGIQKTWISRLILKAFKNYNMGCLEDGGIGGCWAHRASC